MAQEATSPDRDAQDPSNASHTPLAHVQNGPQTAADILGLPDSGKGSNMLVAALRLHDCSLVTDGAAAVVLTSTENAMKTKDKVVEIAGIGHSEEHMPLSQRAVKWELQAGKDAVRKAFQKAGVTAKDIDIAEVHDCFGSTETSGPISQSAERWVGP